MANTLGIKYSELRMERSNISNNWIDRVDGKTKSIEEAALSHYGLDGWKGYHREGGLLLTLIKAMSFLEIQPRNKCTYIEAIYAQNVSFDEDKFQTSYLLSNVLNSTLEQVAKNFDLMNKQEVDHYFQDGFRFSVSGSLSDVFPDIQKWMISELYNVSGNRLIHSIASIFSQDPYEYRRGWPDITMWRDGVIRFVEVKSPKDKLQHSQIVIIEKFIKPLGLDYTLLSVTE